MKRIGFLLGIGMLLMVTGVCGAESALENAVGKAVSRLRMELREQKVALKHGEEPARVALATVRRGGGRDERAERLWSEQLWQISTEFAFIVVDRRNFEAIFDEFDITLSDLFDPKKSSRIGKALGATHLLVGDVQASGKAEDLQMKLIDIETTGIVWACRTLGYRSASPRKAGMASLVIPGLGQFMNGRPGKGTLFLVGAAGLVTTIFVAHERYTKSHDKYLAARTVDEIEHYADEYRSPLRLRNGATIATIAWALGSALDAYLEARSTNKRRRQWNISSSPSEGILISWRGMVDLRW